MLDVQTVVLALLTALGILLVGRLLAPRPSTPSAPTYGPWWLPPFVRGALAAYRLGRDEDGFLLSLRRDYGTAVWIPWPMRQTVILETKAIRRVYAAPEKILSFLPIRREMQGSAFGAPFWDDRSLMDAQVFPAHSRGMSKVNLSVPLQRFIAVVRSRIDELAAQVDAAPSGELTIKLADWVVETYFEASLAGMFGPHVREAKGTTREELWTAFCAFDKAFPIMASGMVPPWLLERIPDVVAGKKGQDVLATTFEAWIQDGFDGLEEGVVRDMAEVVLNNSLGAKEAGKMIIADFWALQANAPYIGVQLLVFLLQAPPSLRADLLSEIDSSLTVAAESPDAEPLTFPHLASTLPLLGSCITETLRLGTATFSIRIVEQPFVLPTSAGETNSHIVIPANTRLICATRVHHLSDEVWDGNAGEWDGRRFYDDEASEGAADEEEPSWKSKRARDVHGFGGGISRCEGQHFATAELKAFNSLFFSTFDLELISPKGKPTFGELYEPVKLAGVEENGFRPRRIPERVGMGAYQFIDAANADLELKVRRRTPRV
ncbi:hypothetical protein JCM10449v2_002650 [Rhodotorula kratochvilovae]